jgi:hypothetical protein
VCLYVYPAIHLLNAEPVVMKLRTNNMASDPISTAYFIDPSQQSVCLYVYHPVVARHRLGKHVPTTLVSRNNRIFGRVAFYAVLIVSDESLWVCCVSPVLVYLPPKRWPEDSQSRQRVKYGRESRGTRNPESLCRGGQQ